MRLRHVFGLTTYSILLNWLWITPFVTLGAVADDAPGITEKDDSTETDAKPEKATEPPTALENIELKVNGTTAVFVAERDLSKGISEAATLKKKAKLATKPVRDIQQEITNLEARLLQAEQQLVALNVQLANVSDVVTNNRLVGTIDAVEGQMSLAQKKLDSLKTKETEAQSNLNKAREAFVQQVLNLRTLANQLTAAYENSADSAEIQANLKKLSAGAGKELALQPSSSLQSQQRKLTELEESIQTERIALRRDGNTFYASVVINGKHTSEMVVDTGASLISLPYELAVSMGLKPEPSDKQILLTIADGSQITGHLKTIDNVRVGTFVASKVQCAVLGPEAVGAEPLLGMSYLGEFQFHLDAADATLGLTQIESDSSSASRRK